MNELCHNRLPLKTTLGLEIQRLLRHTMVREHELRQLFWECTLRCNLHCLHCGSDCKVSSKQPDMPAADFLRVVDSITPHVNTRRLMVVMTGGEPLLREDLEQVGRALMRRNYPWGIVTNGMLLNEERIRRLVDAGMRSVTVSLDGFEQEHNWMRGSAQSYERALAAVRLLAEQKDLVWDIVTCVNRRNYPQLSEFKDMIHQAGVRRWRLFTIFPVGRAAQHPELKLSPDEFRGLMKFIEDTRAEGRIEAEYACEGFLGDYEGRVRSNLYQCHAGISVAGILADGGISSCLSIRHNYRQGNIYEDDFWEIWNNRFQAFRRRQWMRTGECAACGMFRYCEGGGMHLRDDEGKLLFCHLNYLNQKET